MCESVTCNACCSANTAMEDNFWLLLGFIWCLLHFVRHMCLVCFCTSSVVGEVYTLYHGFDYWHVTMSANMALRNLRSLSFVSFIPE